MEFLPEIISLASVLVTSYFVYRSQASDRKHALEIARLEQAHQKGSEEFQARLHLLSTRETDGVRVETELQDQVFQQARQVIESYREEVERLQSDMQVLRDRVSELETSSKEREKEFHALMKDHEDLRRDKDKLAAQLSKTEKLRTSLSSKLEASRDEIAELESIKAKLEIELERAKTLAAAPGRDAAKAAKQELARVQGMYDALQDRHEKVLETRGGDMAEAMARALSAEAKANISEKRASEAERLLAKTESKLKNVIDHRSDDLKVVEEAIARAEEAEAKMKDALDRMSAMEEKVAEADEVRQRVGKMQQALIAARSKTTPRRARKPKTA